MPDINRRSLLAGAAATGALAATASVAAEDMVSAKIDMTGKSVLITGCSTGYSAFSCCFTSIVDPAQGL